MCSDVQQLNTWNMFYSEIFTVRKIAHARTHCMQSQSRKCHHNYVATTTWLEFAMLILTYFKPNDGLPNPKALLSLSIPLQVIALAMQLQSRCRQRLLQTRTRNMAHTYCSCCPYFLTNVVASNTAVFRTFPCLFMSSHTVLLAR